MEVCGPEGARRKKTDLRQGTRKDERDRKREGEKASLRTSLMCVPTGNDRTGGLARVMALTGPLDVGVSKIRNWPVSSESTPALCWDLWEHSRSVWVQGSLPAERHQSIPWNTPPADGAGCGRSGSRPSSMAVSAFSLRLGSK